MLPFLVPALAYPCPVLESDSGEATLRSCALNPNLPIQVGSRFDVEIASSGGTSIEVVQATGATVRDPITEVSADGTCSGQAGCACSSAERLDPRLGLFPVALLALGQGRHRPLSDQS